ncbi:MAG TPA: hypothetical protein VG206_23230 [Terriglobia bacterium]|nr:hypothetical protein [Terriglobia bacterium]
MRKLFSYLFVTFLAAIVLVLPVRAGEAGSAPAGVQIEVPADIPLHITNFGFDPSPSSMTAFHYDVQNSAGQGLVAVEVRWQTQLAGKSGVTVTNRDDRWLTGQLATGQAERFQVTNVPNEAPSTNAAQAKLAPQQLSGMVATVTYAEFEDGTRLGSEAAAIGKEIDAARRTAVAAYAKLLDTFNSSGSEAMVQALKQQNAAHDQSSAVQEATARLLGVLNDQGVDAVVQELQRVAALTIPEGRS